MVNLNLWLGWSRDGHQVAGLAPSISSHTHHGQQTFLQFCFRHHSSAPSRPWRPCASWMSSSGEQGEHLSTWLTAFLGHPQESCVTAGLPEMHSAGALPAKARATTLNTAPSPFLHIHAAQPRLHLAFSDHSVTCPSNPCPIEQQL